MHHGLSIIHSEPDGREFLPSGYHPPAEPCPDNFRLNAQLAGRFGIGQAGEIKQHHGPLLPLWQSGNCLPYARYHIAYFDLFRGIIRSRESRHGDIVLSCRPHYLDIYLHPLPHMLEDILVTANVIRDNHAMKKIHGVVRDKPPCYNARHAYSCCLHV